MSLSWWELMAFIEAAGPTSAICAARSPERYGWTVEAIVTARGLGMKIPWLDGSGSTRSSGNTKTESQRIGTAFDRDELDEWFFAATG